MKTLTRVPARLHFCQWVTGSRPCTEMAVIQVDEDRYCRSHAIDLLNERHQEAVEEVNRIIRGEADLSPLKPPPAKEINKGA